LAEEKQAALGLANEGEGTLGEDKGMKLAAYRRPFVIDGLNCEVVTTSRMTGMDSELRVAGTVVATDRTPPSGPDAVRNHQLRTTLSDGTELDVEAGYVNWLTTGVAVRRGGVLVYESHPGRKIAWPEKAARMVTRPGTGDGAVDPTAWKRNRVPIAVDIALGLLFFSSQRQRISVQLRSSALRLDWRSS
jgi:hypothetical protein